jgi:hypothetical protein
MARRIAATSSSGLNGLERRILSTPSRVLVSMHPDMAIIGLRSRRAAAMAKKQSEKGETARSQNGVAPA